MHVFGLQPSHLLLICTNISYGTVLTVACAHQGCSASGLVFWFFYVFTIDIILCTYLNKKKYVHQEVQTLSAWQMTSSSKLETCADPKEGALFDNGDLIGSYVAVSSETLHHVLLVELHLIESASSFQTIYKKKRFVCCLNRDQQN
jgi:hypothetical protein